MGWKSIELQVALPRVQDAGKIQEQMMKQSQHAQESLASNQLQQDINKRKSVQESNEINYLKSNQNPDDDGDGREHEENKEHDPQSQNKTEHAAHPFLGNKIDFTG